MFTQHNQTVPLSGIISPRPVTVMPSRVSADLLSGDRERINAFADLLIEAERRQHLVDTQAEIVTEGRNHSDPTAPDRHE